MYFSIPLIPILISEEKTVVHVTELYGTRQMSHDELLYQIGEGVNTKTQKCIRSIPLKAEQLKGNGCVYRVD